MRCVDDDTRVVLVDTVVELDILSDDTGGGMSTDRAGLGFGGGRGGGGDGKRVGCAGDGQMGRAPTEIGICVFVCCR